MAGRSRKMLRFRADLQGMPCPIWRELMMREESDFWALHIARQDVFGWEDRHLHAFELAGITIGIPDQHAIPRTTKTLPSWGCKITNYLEDPGATALYGYDFGDDWEHHLTLIGTEHRPIGHRLPLDRAARDAATRQSSVIPFICSVYVLGERPLHRRRYESSPSCD